MTKEHVTDFVSELVTMAQATQRLPQVEAEAAELRGALDHAAATIQRLELKLIERAGEIDALHSNVRSAEAARDDAELRFLEASDSVAAFTRLVKSFSVDAGVLVKALEPEPVAPPFTPEPMVPLASEIAASSPQLRVDPAGTGLTDSNAESGKVVYDESGFSAGFSVGASPTAPSTESGRSPDAVGSNAEPAASASGSGGEGSQREADPIATTSQGAAPYPTSAPASDTATAVEGVSVSSHPTPNAPSEASDGNESKTASSEPVDPAQPVSTPEGNWTTKLGPNPSKPSDPPSDEYWPNAFNRASS